MTSSKGIDLISKQSGPVNIHGKSYISRVGLGALVSLLYSFAGIYVLLYTPVLAIGRVGLVKPLVLVGLVVVSARFVAGRRVSLLPSNQSLFLILLLAALISLFQVISLIRGSDTAFFQLLISLLTGVIPLSFCVVMSLRLQDGAVNRLVRLTASVGGIQALFIALDWTFPAVRDLFSSLVVQPETLALGFRAAGLTSLTGDGLSFSQAIAGVASYFLFVNSIVLRDRVVWFLCFGLILITMIFVGRTGFIIIAFFVFYHIVTSRRQLISLINGIAALILPFVFGLLGFVLIPGDQATLLVERVLPHAFEMFVHASEGEGFSTDSTSALASSHLVFPDEETTWFIGDGFFSDPLNAEVNYKGTDIGYLRILFYVGLSGSLALYSWFGLVLFFGLRLMRNHRERPLFIGLLLCFFVANFKFPFLLMGTVFGFILMFLFAAHRDVRYENYPDY